VTAAAPLRFGSISGTLLARLCVLAGGLATGIASARALEPAGRGQYFTVTTAAAIVAQVANLGLTSSNVFLGARDATRIRALLVNSTVLSLVVALLGTAAVLLWGDALAAALKLPRAMLWPLCLLAPALLLWNLATSLLVAAERFSALNTWQVLNTAAAVAAILACALLHAGAALFALAAALAAALCALLLVAFISARTHGPARFSAALVREGIGFSARAYLALVLGYLLQRSGASLLVAQGSPAEVGQYSIASQVFDVLLIVPASVSLVLFPQLVRQPQDLWHHVRRTTLLTAAAMSMLCLLAALTAPWVLPWVFGARYAGAARALWGLLPAVIAYSIVSVMSQYLVARRFPWSLVAAWAAGLALTLLIGLALTRACGALGAGLSQSAGALLVCALVLLIAARRPAAGAPA